MQDVADLTQQLFPSEINPSEIKLYIKDAGQFWKFIQANSELALLLLESLTYIQKYFLEPSLLLDVVTDWDVPTDHQLIVYISTNLSPREALDILYAFNEAWGYQAEEASNGKLVFSLTYL